MTFPAPRSVAAARLCVCPIYCKVHCNSVHDSRDTCKHVSLTYGSFANRAPLRQGERVHNRLTMSVLNRRRFLAASAASAATAGFGAQAIWAQALGDVDIAVIGAGAAGIAATRRIATSRARVALIEASGRVGG